MVSPGTPSSPPTSNGAWPTDRPDARCAAPRRGRGVVGPVDAPTAIEHAVAAGDGETARTIFSEHWLELFLEGRVDAVHATRSSTFRTPWPTTGDAHLAKALVLVRGRRLDAARAEVAAARTAAASVPEPDEARFDERTAIVELFLTGYDRGARAPPWSPVQALLERLAPGRARAGPGDPGGPCRSSSAWARRASRATSSCPSRCCARRPPPRTTRVWWPSS